MHETRHLAKAVALTRQVICRLVVSTLYWSIWLAAAIHLWQTLGGDWV